MARKADAESSKMSGGTRIRKVSRFTVEPSTSALSTVREFIRTSLRPFTADEPVVFDIVAATHEAAKNAMEHNPGSESPVDVICEVRDDSVVVEVCDRGSGFDPGILPPEPPDPTLPAGRGLYLIYCLMDRVEAETGVGGTRVRMQKQLVPDPR